MRLLLIIPQLSGGGAEVLVSRLSKLLSEKHDVFVATFGRTDKDLEVGGKRFVIEYGKPLTSLNRIRRMVYRIKMLRKIQIENKIDVSVSFLLPADFASIFSVRSSRKIITVHSNMTAATRKKRLLRVLYKFLFLRADRIVAVSKGVKSDLQKNFGVEIGKIDVVHNLVNEPHFCSSLPKSEEIVRLCAAGSFRYPKGQWHLIKAFSKVHRLHPNTELILAGTGEYQNELLSLTKNVGLQGAVSFPGFIPDIEQLFLKCDVFVSSSVYEGFGNVIVEAMSMGLPVVSVDAPFGPKEIIAPSHEDRIERILIAQYGVLTAPFPFDEPSFRKTTLTPEEDALAEGICILLDDNGLQKHYSLVGKERAKAFYAETILPEWIRIIERVS